VVITNSSQYPLRNLRLQFTGGTISVENLEPSTSYGHYIRPTSESHLELEWRDSSGVRQFHNIDVYFEPNDRGSIEITIGPNNLVSWTHKTRDWI
jgi:hypothetical protein